MLSSFLIATATLLLLILLNGYFSLSELAIVSARRERLQPLVDRGQRGAEAALELSQDPTPLLSTVQVGITLIGILAGAFGEATLSRVLTDLLDRIPALAPYSRTISLIIVVGAITFLSVVIGELVPKRLALRNPERIAASVARPMGVLSRIARPLVTLLTAATEGVLRLLGVPENEDGTPVSEEEIKVLVEQGAEAGIFEEAERDMVESIFRFGDRQLRSLMTSRTEIVWLDINDPLPVNREIITESNHSRFPVCDGTLDRVLGIVVAKDLLSHNWTGHDFDLRAVLHAPLFLPETMPALRALERFKQTGIQVALLVDEFGGVEGLVTLIDMMEAIVGDIPTLEEISDPPVVRREDGTLLVDGYYDVDDLKDLLDVEDLPDEGEYHTLGGFVVRMIGRLPRAGDHFSWQGWRFEVIDMDGNRVDKVLIGPDGGDAA